MLANIYLHYTLDLWFEKVFRKDNCGGTAFLAGYADDFVAGFQFRGDAYRIRAALAERLGKFKLSLAEEKTGVHVFTRFRKRDFDAVQFPGVRVPLGEVVEGLGYGAVTHESETAA